MAHFMLNFLHNNKNKTFVLALTIVISLNVITYYNPISGYELSLYNGVPIANWFFLFFIYIISYYFLMFCDHNRHTNCWKYGVTLNLLSTITFLVMPYLRGYIGVRGDSLTNIGMVKDILIYGSTAPQDHYPIIHIFPSILSHIIGIDSFQSWWVGAIIYRMIYILSSYLLANFLFKNFLINAIVVTLTSSIDPLIVWPTMSIYLLLFFYHSYLSSLSNGNKSILIIYLLLLPFTHLLTTLLVMGSLVIILITSRLINCVYTSNPTMKKYETHTIYYLIFETIIWFLWAFYKFGFRFGANLKYLFNQLHYQTSFNDLSQISDTLTAINIS